MRRDVKQKIFVILIAAIFLGSYAGFAISSAPPQENEEEIPSQNILSTISDAQESVILSRGAVVVRLDMPEDCASESDCIEAKLRLEALVATYKPFLFLVEQQATNFSLSAWGYKNSTTFESYNETEIEDFICGNVAYRLQPCVLREFE